MDMEALQQQIADLTALIQQQTSNLRTHYTVDEAARMLGKKPYTVREWCREGRVKAIKRNERRGRCEVWSIPAVEIERYRNEGLLEPDHHRNATQHF